MSVCTIQCITNGNPNAVPMLSTCSITQLNVPFHLNPLIVEICSTLSRCYRPIQDKKLGQRQIANPASVKTGVQGGYKAFSGCKDKVRSLRNEVKGNYEKSSGRPGLAISSAA